MRTPTMAQQEPTIFPGHKNWEREEKMSGETPEVRSDKKKPREEIKDVPNMSQKCPQDVIGRIIERINGVSGNSKRGLADH